jgi:acyl-CoA synthetase (AMP-forming)/AMP-acid ligase II
LSEGILDWRKVPDITPMAMHDTIRDVLTGAGDANGIEFEGRWHQMREFASLLADLDQRLNAMGLGAHARVGLVARNRPAHVGAFAALMATQRYVVMLYSAQSSDAIAADIRRLRLPLVIADTEDWTPQTLEAARDTGSAGIALSQNQGALLAHTNLHVIGEDLRRTGDPAVAMELLSSGTTGPPKRVPLTVANFEQSARDSAATYASGRQDDTAGPNVVFHPLGNVAGVTFVIPFLFHGRPIALLERFRLDRWLDAVRRHRPARTSLPPAVLRTLLDAQVPKEDLASFASIGVGAARLDPELQDQFELRYGIPLLAAYGATEFCGVVANWTPDLYREFGKLKRGSVGRARPGVRLRVINSAAEQEVAPGAIGLLEAQVSRVGEGWIRTSDLAAIDADGFLYLHGRADGAINRGGFKILPDDVARVLRQHEKVADAAVIGLPDLRLGAIPVAAVEPRDGAAPPTVQELEAYARRSLVAYQVPVRFLILPALPRNASMKVSLPELYALFEQSDDA